MLTIWGRINSHNVKKVVWCALEAGIAFERIDVGGSFGYTPEYLAMNPNRLVPTIRDGDFVLWESNAILRFIAQKYAPHLVSADLYRRANGERWMDWQFQFADAQRDAFLGFVRQTPETRDEAVLAKSIETAGRQMTMLDAELADHEWLSGEAFGIADIPMGVYAHTFLSLPMPRPELPHLARWYESLLARPAFAEIAKVPLT